MMIGTSTIAFTTVQENGERSLKKRLNAGSKDGIKSCMNFGFTNPRSNFSSTDPATSRARFISRTTDNIAVLLAIFIPLVLVLSIFASLFDGLLPLLIADAIAIAVAYYLYVLWNKRAIRLRCRSCKKIIVSNTPWFCGTCKTPNLNVNEFPFVHECEHCSAQPKAYRCHHPECKKLIFLSEDEDATNYAHRMNSPDDAPRPDERSQKRQAHEASKEDIEAEIEMAELKERLRKMREEAKKARAKPKSEYEEMEEEFRKRYNGHMGMEDIADELRAEAFAKYKDDPDRLKQAYEAIKSILRAGL